MILTVQQDQYLFSPFLLSIAQHIPSYCLSRRLWDKHLELWINIILYVVLFQNCWRNVNIEPFNPPLFTAPSHPYPPTGFFPLLRECFIFLHLWLMDGPRFVGRTAHSRLISVGGAVRQGQGPLSLTWASDYSHLQGDVSDTERALDHRMT